MTQDILNCVARFFASVDARDWPQAQSLMTDPFHLDYSSFGAGEAAELAPVEVMAGWKRLLPGFDHTHHQLGNFDVTVEDDRAVVRCYGTATHVIAGAADGPVWTVIGAYTLTLTRVEDWLLSGSTFHFRYQSGNLELPGIAAKRAAEGI